LISFWGACLSGLQAQSYFTFSYTGPEALYADISCLAELDWGHPQTPTVEYDAPPGGVLLSFDIWAISGGYEIGDTLPVGDTVTVTYEALDNQGNFEFFTFELPVLDSVPPEVDWSSFSDSLSVSCQRDLFWTPPPVHDNCTPEENIIWASYILDSISPCTGGQTTRIFEARDEFGNVSAYEQSVIMILDSVAPEITVSPMDTTFYCEVGATDISQWLQGELNRIEAIDPTCDSVFYSIDSAALMGLESLCGERIIPFIASDVCGNKTIAEATLTILDTLPTSLLTPAEDTLIHCGGQEGLGVLESWLSHRGGMEVEDNCELFYSYAPSEIDLLEVCNQGLEVTFTAVDRCGAAVSSTARLELLDTLPPEFLNAPSNLISSCANENYLDRAENWLVDIGGGLVQDECAPDTLIEVSYRVDGEEWVLHEVLDSLEKQSLQGCRDSVLVGGNRIDNVLISLQLEFLLRDPCGNTLTSMPRFLALIDSEDPVILGPARDSSIVCSDSLQVRNALLAWYDDRASLRVMDDCGEVLRRPSIDRDDVWGVYLQENSTNCGFAGEITLDFTVEDLCGRMAPMQEATFFAIDTVAPELTELPSDLSLACSSSARDSLMDWLDAGAYAQFSESCGGVRLDSFFWSDSEGRSGVGLSGVGPYPDVSQLGCQYEIEVDFQVKNDCENTGVFSASFSLVDALSPRFMNYPDSLQLTCGEEAEIFENLIIDDCFPNSISLQITDDTLRQGSSEDCSFHAFSIARTLVATDICGNSETFEQHISYSDDTPPVFSPPGDTAITCEDWDAGIPVPEPTGVVDDCIGPVTVHFQDSIVDQSCGFIVFRNWALEDVCGNQSTHVQQIDVLDEQPPVFDRTPESGRVFCHNSHSDAEDLFTTFLDTLSADFSDVCSSVDSFIALAGSYDLNNPTSWPGTLPTDFSWSCGTYASDTLYHVDLAYVIYDGCEQAREATFSFTVLDTISPQIECGNDTVLYVSADGCERDFEVPLPNLDWGCTSTEGRLWVRIDSMDAIETLSPDTVSLTLPIGIHTVEYLARSCNSNEEVCSFNVSVLDTIRPEITCPADRLFSCLQTAVRCS